MRIFLAMFCICLFAASTWGGPLSDLNFDPFRISPSARILGQGRAHFVPDEGEPSAIWFTPTGVPTLPATEALFASPERFTASFSYPLAPDFLVGIGFANHTVNGMGVGTQEVAYLGQIGKIAVRFPITNWLGKKLWVAGVGITLPFTNHVSITGQVDRGADLSPSLDLGLRTSYTEDTELGISIQGLLGTIAWRNGERDDVPLRLGIGLRYPWGEVAVVSGSLQGTTVHAGGKYVLNKSVNIYGGIDQVNLLNNSRTFVSGAIEWDQNPLTIDVALSQAEGAGGYRTFLSFRYLLPAQLAPEIPEEIPVITPRERPKPLHFFSPQELLDVLKILEPAGTSETSAESILVRGRVHPDFVLLVNGAETHIGSDGTFAVQVPLNVGPNVINFEAWYHGQAASTERYVYRRPPTLVLEMEKLRRRFSELPTREVISQSEEIVQRLRELQQELQESFQTTAVGSPFLMGKGYLTRREMAYWLAQAFQLPFQKFTARGLPDVTPRDPSLGYIRAVLEAHLMSTSSDGRFRPEDPLTGDEVLTIFRQ